MEKSLEEVLRSEREQNELIQLEEKVEHMEKELEEVVSSEREQNDLMQLEEKVEHMEKQLEEVVSSEGEQKEIQLDEKLEDIKDLLKEGSEKLEELEDSSKKEQNRQTEIEEELKFQGRVDGLIEESFKREESLDKLLDKLLDKRLNNEIEQPKPHVGKPEKHEEHLTKPRPDYQFAPDNDAEDMDEWITFEHTASAGYRPFPTFPEVLCTILMIPIMLIMMLYGC